MTVIKLRHIDRFRDRLQLVPRRREMERTADAYKRPRHVEREVAAHALRLRLGRLAQPFRIEQRGEAEGEEAQDDAPAGGCL